MQEKRLELIRLAIVYVGGTNGNHAAQVRRILSQRFGVNVDPSEVESAGHAMAADTILALKKLAEEVRAAADAKVPA